MIFWLQRLTICFDIGLVHKRFKQNQAVVNTIQEFPDNVTIHRLRANLHRFSCPNTIAYWCPINNFISIIFETKMKHPIRFILQFYNSHYNVYNDAWQMYLSCQCTMLGAINDEGQSYQSYEDFSTLSIMFKDQRSLWQWGLSHQSCPAPVEGNTIMWVIYKFEAEWQ